MKHSGKRYKPRKSLNRRVGPQLRAIREQLGLSAVFVATALQTTVQRLRRIEKGKELPTPFEIYLFSQVTKTDIDSIFKEPKKT